MIGVTLILLPVLIMAIYWPARRGEFLFDDWAIADMDFPRREEIARGRIIWNDPRNRAAPPVEIPVMLSAFPLPLGWHSQTFFFLHSLRSFWQEPRSLTHIGYLWTWRAAGRPLEVWRQPGPWHAVNIGLHILNVFLVYLVLNQVFPPYAVLGTLLFAVHPHQVAAVAYISGRASLQTTAFALGVALIVLQIFTVWSLVGILLAAGLAHKSKEDGLLWVLGFGSVAAVWHYWFGSI